MEKPLTKVVRRPPPSSPANGSDYKIAAAREERDAARESARRARENARQEKAAGKLAKKEARQEKLALAKQYGKLALIFGAAVAAGATIGGQMTRVNKPWMGKFQASLILAGLLLIALAKNRMWMQVAGIGLISAGGVTLSDLSRTRDWIPGTSEWEKPIPPAGTEGYRIEVVPNNG
jgi:hypothetical protein